MAVAEFTVNSQLDFYNMAARLAQLALLAAGTSGLRVFRPSSITIRRQIGQLGFATETE